MTNNQHPVLNGEFPGVITFKLTLAALAIIGIVGWPWFLWARHGHAFGWMIVGIIWDALVTGIGGLVAYAILRESHERRSRRRASQDETRKRVELAVEQAAGALRQEGPLHNGSSGQGRKTIQTPRVTQSQQPRERVDTIEQIQRWATLRDQGLLTDDEFQHQKRKLLDM